MFKGFDLLVKVLKVHEKDEQTVELRVKDITNRLWSIDLPKYRFQGVLNINNGEIIRIRNVMTDLSNRRNILTLKSDTNVLKFLPSSKIVFHMKKEIPEITDQDKMLLQDSSEVLLTPVKLTKITSDKENQPREQMIKPFRL